MWAFTNHRIIPVIYSKQFICCYMVEGIRSDSGTFSSARGTMEMHDLLWTTEVTYGENPVDDKTLIKWGTALLRLSTAKNVEESKTMVKYAIWRLHTALSIDPKKHEALWCMGSALTSLAILTPNKDSAKRYFDSAYAYFQKAKDEYPDNELYRKSIAEAAKAIESHQQAMASGASTSSYARFLQGFKSWKMRAVHYDVSGWVILAVSVVVWVRSAKANAYPPQ